jgi:squalene-hopene/tetraprenyl-beta-curcumene cyclase
VSLAKRATDLLLSRRNAQGVWEGRLSSSALSTATAILALSSDPEDADAVAHGREWLVQTQNNDGGWGDTTLSLSNISTTALCWAASPSTSSVKRAEAWLANATGSLDPEVLGRAIAARYGKDRTFSVPILTALAIGGRVGWQHAPQLPFELAACPHQWFQWLKLPVVSYALPALIAIGLARHRRFPSRNPGLRMIRNTLTPRVLRVLRKIQPSGGGFLEATPLTSFVAMSLIAADLGEHEVTQKCLAFLRISVRPDGSWPIDTNLSTWLTTLATNALGEEAKDVLSEGERSQLSGWLLDQQFQVEHPYTHAAPGAWSWTNLSGAVPDADDTAGALLALKHLGVQNERVRRAAFQGVRWLLDLQNSDGGMPTFCKGWGHLPFDRSGPDLTAHALRAWRAWLPELPASDRKRAGLAIRAGLDYLRRSRKDDGSWVPLWFGNQYAPGGENRTFGTSRVILALCELQPKSEMLSSAVEYLLSAQHTDGGWGGAPLVAASIDETALAADALACVLKVNAAGRPEKVSRSVRSATEWLANATRKASAFTPSPIGFYFASLWYFEELYPLVFSVSALRRAQGLRDTQEPR